MTGGVMEEREREASVSSSSDFYGPDENAPKCHVTQDALPPKRKASALESSQDKKRKLDSPSTPPSPDLAPCAGLPPAIWQHVFLFCPVRALGRLLQVNRSFHSYLTAVRSVSNVKPDTGFLRLLKSESIWVSVRNNMCPAKPPKPLPGFGELQMWQFVWSRHCQFCGKQGTFTPGEKIWQQGPGAAGVRVIWPFGIRACGPCLMKKCQSDASLLFSNASALRPAIPFAFITNDQHYIPAYTLQAATTPANVEIVKYYYKPHVEEITEELEHALSMGTAAAEEWSKGLDLRGKERMKVAENWERWDYKYQWWQKSQEPKRDLSAAPSPASTYSQPRASPALPASSPVIHAPVPTGKYRSIHPVAWETAPHSSRIPTPGQPLTTPAATVPPQAPPRPATIPPHVYTPHPVPSVGPTSVRGERNLHDANEAKASRKLEIERRCQLMDPPIPANLLRHMESFKAAIQISQPMNDYAWGMLHPRLLAQLPAARQAESDHASTVASLTTRAADRRQPDTTIKEVKEAQDRDWEESQRPIRDRLSAIADDFINQDWDHGRAVTYENSPKFAVDLLMYVRRRFYAELGGTEASTVASSGPKLVLDNMKWVYDNKLKPLTEQFRKELFLCHGNSCEGNTRFYGFEGVIQHFGAKHTNTFSSGNVVVAWREAEWPEETPFHPDPISVKQNYGNSAYGSYYNGHARAGTATPHMQAHISQSSPAPYGYGSHYNGPFQPPQATPGYECQQPYSVPDMYPYQPVAPSGHGPLANHNGYMTSPALSTAAVGPPPVTTYNSQIMPLARPLEPGQRTNLYDKQVSTVVEAVQDIWKQTSGIKDFPNNLRIYVLLHRVISKFHVEFNHEPDLNHFIDAFSSPEISPALKNATGLSCKACQEGLSHRPSAGYPSREEARRTYTLLNLLSHFQSQHNGLQDPRRDWKEDMIELPSNRFISGQIHAPGMDDDKLHMIATVFPGLFPTPLPRIGIVDANGVASLAYSGLKDSRDAITSGETPGTSTRKSGPSSLGSPYSESPRPPRPNDDEYDPQHPAILAQEYPSARTGSRVRYQAGSPPTDHGTYYSGDSQYYLPRAPQDRAGPREYVERAPDPRIIRDAGTAENYPRQRPRYMEHAPLYSPAHDDVMYARPRAELHAHEYGTTREIRYLQDDHHHPEYRVVREPRPRELSPTGRTAADRFLENFVPPPPLTGNSVEKNVVERTASKPPTVEGDFEDESRYTPPPLDTRTGNDQPDHGRSLAAVRHNAPSTGSNGSKYEEHRSEGRQPNSGPRRGGPHRRRERHHEHAPSRYHRYSVVRDEPYSRGASMGRAQSKRYERYEEQRRRLDQQETPQPPADRDYEPPYSRDQSVDQGPLEEPYEAPLRPAPREYIPIQDRLHPYSPPRYRYAASPEGARGPPPVYVDEYGQPVHEYEIIRVPRDQRQPRGPHSPARYYQVDSDHLPYVPYDRPLPQHNGRPRERVYYEEREQPPLARRRAFEPEAEAPYEPLPDIKVEDGAPPPVLEGL